MKTIYALLAITVLLVSCRYPKQSSTENSAIGSTPIPPLHLAGQSYFFGPQFNDTACKVEAGCDCCASSILFTDDHRFIAIFYCLQDDTYAHGSYRIDSDKVYLSYEGNKVDVLTDFTVSNDTLSIQGNTVLSTTQYKIDTMPHSIDTLRAFLCQGKVGFKSKEIDYGMPDSIGAFKTLLDNLRADSTLARMGYRD